MDDDFAEHLERETVVMYRLFGLDADRGYQSLELVHRFGLELVLTDRPMPGGARLGAGKRVWVQRGIRPKRAFFDVSHELAAYLLREWGYVEPDSEERENRLAACLLLPRPAMVTALRSAPWRGVRDLAYRLRVTETCAALRLGECTSDPIAVITRHKHVLVRGEDRWPDAPERLAHARQLPPGMFRHRIERERVVVGIG
jgi:hypothetical protein